MNGFKDKIIFSSSVLSTNGVVSFLNATYSIGEICCCELMHSNINDTFKIKTTLGTFACKVYGKLFTYKEIYNKIKDCEEIGKLGIKIAHNIKNISGKSLSLIDCPEGIRFIEITSWADGREFNYSKIKDAYIYGKSLAKLHIETVDKKIFKRRLNLYDRFIDMKNVILEFIKCDRCLYDN